MRCGYLVATKQRNGRLMAVRPSCAPAGQAWCIAVGDSRYGVLHKKVASQSHPHVRSHRDAEPDSRHNQAAADSLQVGRNWLSVAQKPNSGRRSGLSRGPGVLACVE